jgi:hypothetical protein
VIQQQTVFEAVKNFKAAFSKKNYSACILHDGGAQHGVA